MVRRLLRFWLTRKPTVVAKQRVSSVSSFPQRGDVSELNGKRSIRKIAHKVLFRCVLALSIVLQVTAPAGFAERQSGQINIHDIYCTPSGDLSDAAKTATERLLKILEKVPEDEDGAHSGHCSLCTLSAMAVLPDFVAYHSSLTYLFKRVVPRYEPGLIHRPNGPPLGSRSPPSHT